MRNVTPLRYPGGKQSLTPWLTRFIEHNRFFDHVYVEPFAGGAGAALKLLYKDVVEQIHLNDLDPAIYSIWDGILNSTERFISDIESCTVDLETWRKMRELVKRSHSPSYELGFAAFYLNRTCVSGVITGGPIGGVKQSGKYAIDARFNKTDLIRRIESVAAMKDKIEITNLDAIDLMQRISQWEKHNAFVYLDPPYYIKGPTLYRNSFNHEDHVRLAEFLRHARFPWVVSYDDCPEIRQLYHWTQPMKLEFGYTAGTKERKVGREVVYCGNADISFSNGVAEHVGKIKVVG